jgi:CRISPR-associated helicase Cas3
MYVAPVNSLVSQLLDDIRCFLQEEGLERKYIVFPVMSRTLFMVKKRFKDEGEKFTNGDFLAMLFNNPAYLNPVVTSVIKEELGKSGQEIVDEERNYIIVINPDILYHALFSDFYNRQKQNIHLALLNNVKYSIFDEFHYYDFFQLNAFISLVSAWKVLGKFDDCKKLPMKACLLSATPNEKVENFMERAGMKVAVISDKSGNKNGKWIEIPFLGPVTLHLHTKGKHQSFATQMIEKTDVREALESYLDEGKWGVIICNSMNQANRIYHHYNKLLGDRYSFSRITGAVKASDREEAVNARCIITTSTVDIGFNFERIAEFSSKRQNIDFLFVDFFNHDELVQRIGRAGRVLGKEETEVSSNVHFFLDHGALVKARKLKDEGKLDGRRRNEILSALKPVAGDRDYGLAMFREYGYFIAREFVSNLRKYLIVEKWQEVREKERDGLMNRLEDIMKSIYLDGKTERSINRLSLLHDKSRNDESFSDIPLKRQASFAYHYIKDWLYRPVDGNNGPNLLETIAMKEGFDDPVKLRRILLDALVNSNEDEKVVTGIIKKFGTKEIAMYYQYTRMFFSSLINNFRGDSFIDTLKNKITIIDDGGYLSPSRKYSYDLLHVMKYHNYDVVDEKTTWKNGIERHEVVIRVKGNIDNDRHRQSSSHPVMLRLYLGNDAGMTMKKFKENLFNFLHVNPGNNDISIKCNGTKTPAILRSTVNKGMFGYLLPDFYMFKTRLLSLPLEVTFRDGSTGMYAFFPGKNGIEMKSTIS